MQKIDSLSYFDIATCLDVALERAFGAIVFGYWTGSCSSITCREVSLCYEGLPQIHDENQGINQEKAPKSIRKCPLPSSFSLLNEIILEEE